MTYLIGAILVVLLIALVLVFRPPKLKPYEDAVNRGIEEDSSSSADDQLDLEVGHGGQQTVVDEEEFELTLDESVEEMDGQSDEEELDLVFDRPGPDSDGGVTGPMEDLDLILEEESDDVQPAAEEKGSDEYDEDIQFIDDSEGAHERKVEIAPALADVPEDYAVIEEEETSDELAERLEYFLGSDDEEDELVVEETILEQVDVEEEAETVEEAVEETVEANSVVEAEPEVSSDDYSKDLQEQEERLRSALNAAIENREIIQLGPLEVALENLCVKQVDIQTSFQQFQNLVDDLDAVMSEVQQVLPSFQLESARTNIKEGEYEAVRTLLTEASSQLDDSPQLAARALYQWGKIEEERGELTAALEMYSTAQSQDEENPGYLYAAGRLARITGDGEKALSWLEKRVNTGKELGEESVDLAMAEHELAKVLAMAEEDNKVEPLLVSAQEKIEKLLGGEHPSLGPVLHDLGALHDSSARFEQAEPLYKKALEIGEQGLGKDSPRLGTTLNKLAGLYEEIEMEDESERLYFRALEIKQKVLGENHPDVGAILNHLANLLKLQGKHDQAEPMFIKSLAIAEAALGKDHPNLAVVLNNMAELYSEMGNEKQAEYFQERAFSLFGLPGMGDGFVEMDKDTDYEVDNDKDESVTGS